MQREVFVTLTNPSNPLNRLPLAGNFLSGHYRQAADLPAKGLAGTKSASSSLKWLPFCTSLNHLF
jgi:hypothetical protein